MASHTKHGAVQVSVCATARMLVHIRMHTLRARTGGQADSVRLSVVIQLHGHPLQRQRDVTLLRLLQQQHTNTSALCSLLQTPDPALGVHSTF